jgi:hypothetical protein
MHQGFRNRVAASTSGKDQRGIEQSAALNAVNELTNAVQM